MNTVNRLNRTHIFHFAIVLLLTACGGGGGSSSPSAELIPTPPATVPPAIAASASMSIMPIKSFRFDWTDVGDASHYRLMENPDGVSGYSQVGSDIPRGVQSYNHVVPLYARINARYILQSCNAAGCIGGTALFAGANVQAAIGYLKASNSEAGDNFGRAISLSADGNTLAVGAIGEDSAINGNPSDNSAFDSGAVYLY